MRTAATLLLALAMATAALGLAVAAPGGDRRLAGAQLVSATGAVHITNSRAGQAVFSAAGIRPGQGVSGAVRIGNDGDVAGRFSLRPSGLVDSPGPGGQLLSAQLRLVVSDVTDVHAPVTVYAGPPAAFGELGVGTIGAGQHRDFLFAATLPATAGNGVQGAGISLGFEWRAAAIPVATPTPTPTAPKPTPTPAPTPRPVPPPAPTGAALADALGLPPARTCVSRRSLKLLLKAPGARVVSATLAVKRKVRRLDATKAAAPVTLRRLPKRRFKLKVTVSASDGKTYTSSRTYRGCRTRKRTA